MKNIYTFITRFLLIVGMAFGTLVRPAAMAVEADAKEASIDQQTLDPRLERAIKEKDLERVKTLILEKVSVNGRDRNGLTALMLANADMVQPLISAGAKLDIQDRVGYTPLIRAVLFNHADIAQLLINAGAALDVQDLMGTTALKRAAIEGNDGIAKALVEAGALLDLQDCDGNTDLMVAAFNDNYDIAKMLIIAGADLYIKNNQGFTVLDKDFTIFNQRKTSKQKATKKARLEEAIAERDRIRVAKGQEVQPHLPVPGIYGLVMDYYSVDPDRAPRQAEPVEDEPN